MKRATLTAYPTTHPSEPVDLTDRLLEREANPSSAPAVRRRRKQLLNSPTQPQSNPPPATPASAPEASSTSAPEASSTTVPASTGLETALAAADLATQALRRAAGEAPARYDVALHYRLDALAHHVQQVKEFVANLATR